MNRRGAASVGHACDLREVRTRRGKARSGSFAVEDWQRFASIADNPSTFRLTPSSRQPRVRGTRYAAWNTRGLPRGAKATSHETPAWSGSHAAQLSGTSQKHQAVSRCGRRTSARGGGRSASAWFDFFLGTDDD